MKSTRASPAMAWLLSLCLLLAVGWGQWHGALHASAAARVQALGSAALAAASAPDAGNAAVSDAGKDASGHAAGSALCQVLDHLAHPEGLNPPAIVVVRPLLPMPTPSWCPALRVAWGDLHCFEARAPPRSV